MSVQFSKSAWLSYHFPAISLCLIVMKSILSFREISSCTTTTLRVAKNRKITNKYIMIGQQLGAYTIYLCVQFDKAFDLEVYHDMPSAFS